MTASDLETAVLGWLGEQRAAMTALLEAIVNVDSGSTNRRGIEEVSDIIKAHLAVEGVDVEELPQEPAACSVRATCSGPNTDAGTAHALLLGHRDTVFPDGTVAQRPFRAEGDLAYGPGVSDMKAGLVLNSFVLAAFQRAGGAPRPLLGLYTSDEEIASPHSAGNIRAAARGARAVFNAEPGRPSGNVVTGRKGGTFLKVEITGKAAHSGGAHDKGISAIEELARKITALHALTDYETGTTLNVGLISGGQTVNTVAPWARCEIDLRFTTPERRDAAMAAIREVLDTTHLPGTTTRIAFEAGFLPLVPNPQHEALFALYRAGAERLGFSVEGEYSGGCADSGLTSDEGAPTLCSTGPVGGQGHTPDEYCRLDTLVPRAQAVALAVLGLDG